MMVNTGSEKTVSINDCNNGQPDPKPEHENEFKPELPDDITTNHDSSRF